MAYNREIMENKEFNLFVETISLEDMNDFRGYVVNEHLLYLEHPDFYKDYIPAQYKPKEKSSTTIINTMNLFCVFLHWCKKMGMDRPGQYPLHFPFGARQDQHREIPFGSLRDGTRDPCRALPLQQLPLLTTRKQRLLRMRFTGC